MAYFNLEISAFHINSFLSKQPNLLEKYLLPTFVS